MSNEINPRTGAVNLIYDALTRRPNAGNPNTLFWDNTNQALYFDNGVAWVALTTGGTTLANGTYAGEPLLWDGAAWSPSGGPIKLSTTPQVWFGPDTTAGVSGNVPTTGDLMRFPYPGSGTKNLITGYWSDNTFVLHYLSTEAAAGTLVVGATADWGSSELRGSQAKLAATAVGSQVVSNTESGCYASSANGETYEQTDFWRIYQRVITLSGGVNNGAVMSFDTTGAPAWSIHRDAGNWSLSYNDMTTDATPGYTLSIIGQKSTGASSGSNGGVVKFLGGDSTNHTGGDCWVGPGAGSGGANGFLDLRNISTDTGAVTGGAANALPAQPVAYMKIKVNGSERRIAYYSP